MKNSTSWLMGLLLVTLITTIFSCDKADSREERVLVFSKTEGFRHESIEAGVEAIQKLGRENGFTVVHTEDAELIHEEVLKDLSAVVFLSTTGDILNTGQQADFERFVQAGGGFVGIHAAADTEYDWKWYGDLVGGYFHSHPEQQEADILVVDPDHRSTEMLPNPWTRFDEWYNYKEVRDGLNVLLKLDESSYEGGNMGDDHPIAWYHDHDGGRAWYTGLGHTSESFSEDLFLQHILQGIKYAIGDNKVDYAKTTTYRLPDPSRFEKTTLATNLDEPMELDMLPDGRILFVERKGKIKMYNPGKDHLSIVTHLPVHTEFEDGLLGIAVDPKYEENHWLYLFYSSLAGPKQHVSRFVFKDDTLHRASEQVLLEIPVQRETCCHSAGSLEFGPDGLLYISTGDDTNPFASDGYAPIDERPGRKPWDAQRSSANTNDLRGKILRIKPETDGTYSIPEGNLFEQGNDKARPEIYAMGLRNPFRMSIDSRRNWLFWGDVGPDAGKDNPERGPKGLDGINMAQKSGFWGWPYSRGNNQVYHDYNFSTGQPGAQFNAAKPINDSPNNSGLRELPPAQSSLIWYSYDESEEFPWVGTGGKNPMAGPVYYVDEYPAATRLPDYFDGKLIIYEWMRHWFYTVKLDSTGNFIKADPLMENIEFSRPMDVIVGNDGRLYLLEYGQLWFSRNLDARLSRIDYIRGNRSPQARITADRWVGGAPLTLQLSASASSDPDGDKLQYEWWIGQEKLEETSADISPTIKYPGTYTVKLKVRDKEGDWDITTAEVQAGNEPPQIAWQIEGNRSFYWDKRSIPYQVSVRDREDGSSGESGFDDNRVSVSFDYLPQGVDVTEIAQGHLAGMAASQLARGAKLIEESDCQNCHAKDTKVNGPSYQEIAARYRNNVNAETTLATKVINGGSGVWGETAMSAHPQLSEEQAREMVRYILTLGDAPAVEKRTHNLKGAFVTKEHLQKKEKGVYVLMATYTDLGNGQISPITAREEIVLRYVRMEAENAPLKSPSLQSINYEEMELFVGFGHNDFFGFENIDLTNIKGVRLQVGSQKPLSGGAFAVYRESMDGELLGQAALPVAGKPGFHSLEIPLSPADGPQNLLFVYQNEDATQQNFALDWVEFIPEGQEVITSR